MGVALEHLTLAKLRSLRSLRLSNCPRLDGAALVHISGFVALTEVAVVVCQGVECADLVHLSQLSALLDLHRADGRGTEGESLTHLSPLSATLRRLDASTPFPSPGIQPRCQVALLGAIRLAGKLEPGARARAAATATPRGVCHGVASSACGARSSATRARPTAAAASVAISELSRKHATCEAAHSVRTGACDGTAVLAYIVGTRLEFRDKALPALRPLHKDRLPAPGELHDPEMMEQVRKGRKQRCRP